jgi:hypothetical protein
MTNESQQKIENLLKEIPKDRPFSIEEFVRTLLNKDGERWHGVWEVQAQVEIEEYLNNRGLINEYGTTKLYQINNDKVKKL